MNFIKTSFLLTFALLTSSLAFGSEESKRIKRVKTKKSAASKKAGVKAKKVRKTTKAEPTAVRHKIAAKKHTMRKPAKPIKREPTKIRQVSTRTQAQARKASTAKTKSFLERATDYVKSEYLTAPARGALASHAAVHKVHHRGPEGFFEKHNFPRNWSGGFIGRWEGNRWLFGGYGREWWKENFPTYYKDVIHPEYKLMGGNE